MVCSAALICTAETECLLVNRGLAASDQACFCMNLNLTLKVATSPYDLTVSSFTPLARQMSSSLSSVVSRSCTVQIAIREDSGLLDLHSNDDIDTAAQ